MRQLKVNNFIAILIGAAIMGFGINFFNIANNLAEGGVTGIAVILKLLFNWDPGLVSFLLNIPLLILGWKVLGRYSLIYTIYGTLCLSLFLWVFRQFRFPIDDMLLASLFAGLSVGIGLGIIFRFGGTTGGVDIVARIFQKYFGWRIGRTMLAGDVLIILISLVVLTPQQVMYTLVAVFVGTKVIDFVVETAYSARSAIIVSDKGEDIAKRIMLEMGRGVTVLHGAGAYSGQGKEVIYVVVGRSEIIKLKNCILSVDPGAFVSVMETTDVMGEGFTLDKNKQPVIV